MDPATKVATMQLNTKNFTLFQLVRKKIREYTGIDGVSFDTYEKSAFIAHHGIMLYIPSQYKQMPIQLIVGIIQRNHPQINYPYKILESSTFTTEGPGFTGGRSRIGDQIVLLEGSTQFMEGLKLFPERYPFQVSKTWKLTIRGGKRSDQTRESENMGEFTEQFRNSVLVGSVDDAMKEARKKHGERPL